MKTQCMIALCMLGFSINISGQKHNSASAWEISFGKSWGRFHQHVEKQTIDSSGLITYSNKRNGTPTTGLISGQDIKAISELLKRLNLQKARPIPSSEFNRCIVSPHMPTSYFSLSRGGNKYSLSPCRGNGYTLNLSVGEKATYKKLQAKVESLFDDEIKKQAN